MNYFPILAIENTTKISVLGRDNEQAVKKGKSIMYQLIKTYFLDFVMFVIFISSFRFITFVFYYSKVEP